MAWIYRQLYTAELSTAVLHYHDTSTNLTSTYEQPIMVCMWRLRRQGAGRVRITLSLYAFSSNAHCHRSQVLIHSKPVLMFCNCQNNTSYKIYWRKHEAKQRYISHECGWNAGDGIPDITRMQLQLHELHYIIQKVPLSCKKACKFEVNWIT